MKSRHLYAIALLSLGLVALWFGRAHKISTASDHSAPAQFARGSGTPLRVAARTLARHSDSTNRSAQLLAALDAETDQDRREEQLTALVNSVAAADVPATLTDLVAHDSPAAAELRDRLIERWAGQAPAAAADWATQLPDSPARTAALKQIASTWAGEDLDAAVDWINTLPEDTTVKPTVTLDVAYEAARTNALLALQLAAPLAASSERDALLVHAIRQWTDTDAATASTWIANIPDPALQQRLIAALAVALSKSDATSAAALASTSLNPGGAQNRTTIIIVQQWAQTAPATAAQWVEQFPAGQLRDTATQNLLTIWTAQDATSAGQWVNTLPAGTAREAALSAYNLALQQATITAAADQATNAPAEVNSGTLAIH